MAIRWKSSAGVLDYPLVCVALGADPAGNEVRGHARGIIAIGDVATGVIAIGGLACGVVALGGLSVGLLAFAGLALGYVAVGGLAIGYAAAGGLAIGYYAMGGVALGKFIIAPLHRDPQAVAFFAKLGLHLPPGPVRPAK